MYCPENRIEKHKDGVNTRTIIERENVHLHLLRRWNVNCTVTKCAVGEENASSSIGNKYVRSKVHYVSLKSFVRALLTTKATSSAGPCGTVLSQDGPSIFSELEKL